MRDWATCEPEDAPRPAYLRGISAADLMAKQFEPVRYIVPGYVAEGCTLLAGAPKIGKSWLALNLSVAVASGRPAFGTVPVDPGDVLYLALEDNQRRLKKRLLHMGVTSPPDRLTLATDWPALDNGCIDELTRWAHDVEAPTLVIVDVLQRVRPNSSGNEQIYTLDYRALTGLQRFASRHSLAVLVLTHTRKAPSEDDPFDAVSGSRGLTGAADSVLILKRDNGTGVQGRATIYGRGRDIEEIETVIEFKRDIGTWSIVGAASEVARTSEREAVREALRSSVNPMSARDISDVSGKGYDAVRKMLARMARDGEVERKGRGLYVSPIGPMSQRSPCLGHWDTWDTR